MYFLQQFADDRCKLSGKLFIKNVDFGQEMV